jgi:putative SOS response-associated peptidase YedK
MCGRYGRRGDKQFIAEHYQIRRHEYDGMPEEHPYAFAPSYNIAPQTMQPVIRLDHETGERELAVMKWGLVPYWSKTPKIPYSTINADANKLTMSGVWREPFKHRRCLIPADWFYEWPVIDGQKQAHAFGLQDGSTFAFAGLWDRWKNNQTGDVLESYAIVTTDPSEWMERYHDRMGVILEPKDYQRWLEPGEPSHLPIDLLRPYPEEQLKVWRVSNDVGNVRNNWPELIEPVL